LGWSSTNGDGHRVFAESLTWYPRNVKQSITRGDLNDARLNLTYDGASRFLAAQRQADASNAFTAGLPQQWSFEYDEAQNLLERTEDGCCGDTTQVAMPLDGSQRNRLGSVGAIPLAWDGSGNLSTKGSYTFHYDYRNRLVKVEHPQQATVEYDYDAFNRRVEKRVAGGATETTVWSGWQELETYGNGVLKERVTYGAGLDEIVRLENLTSGLVHLPVYDATGNLVMVLDADGQPVERYEYSPFGERWIFADSDPPEIEQVRLKDETIWLEISEEVDFEELQAAVGDGRLVLTDEDANETLAVAVTRPVGGGRQAGRRAVITPATTPAVGTQVKLEMSAGTLLDFFGNAGEDSLELTFDWPAGNLIFLDAVAPRVEQVCTKNGALEVQFSEEVDLSLATGLILVDGQAQTWSLAPDRYTLVSAPLTDGVHELSISAGSALDLDGQGLASGFSETFSVGSGTPADQVVWSAGAPGSIASSAVENRFGFHGRPLDLETGLLYFRNRYYDPELGRFITTDPLGYFDSPSLYPFALNNPVNYSDPLGLACTAEHGGVNNWCNPMDEMEISSDTSGWYMAWAVAKDAVGNTVSEALFLNVFADAPHVVTDPEASTGEKLLASGKATGAAALNLGGAGVVVKAGLGRLAATRPVQWTAQRLSRSRFGQRVAGVLMEDVGVLWRRAFGQADDVVEEAGGRLVLRGGARPTLAQVRALRVLGVNKADRRAFFAGQPVRVTVPTAGGKPTVGYVQLRGQRLRAGIVSIEDRTGGGLKGFLDFRGSARQLSRELGARELELSGALVVNPRIEAMLLRQGFTKTKIHLPKGEGPSPVGGYRKIFHLND
jgi:RHS repeat-associated protein